MVSAASQEGGGSKLGGASAQRVRACRRLFDTTMASPPLRFGILIALVLAFTSAAFGVRPASAQDTSPERSTGVVAQPGGREPVRVTGERLEQVVLDGVPLLVLHNVRVEQEGATITGRIGRYDRKSGRVWIDEDVVMTDADSRVTGDRATYDVGSRVGTMTGNVRLREGTIDIRAPRGRFDRGAGMIWLYDGVDLEDNEAKRRVRADSLVYWTETERVRAFGDVRIDDQSEDITVRGRLADFDRGGEDVQVSRDASLVLQDQGQPIIVSAEELLIQSGDDLFEADGDVRVQQGLTEAYASHATFERRNGRAWLTGSPVALSASGRVRGDSLKLRFRNGAVDGLTAVGRARSIYRGAENEEGRAEEMRLSADLLDVRVRDGEAEEVIASGNATSFYVPGGESFGSGARSNVAKGDRIRLLLSGGEPLQAVIEKGASGVYTFEELQPTPAEAGADSGATTGSTGRIESLPEAGAGVELPPAAEQEGTATGDRGESSAERAETEDDGGTPAAAGGTEDRGATPAEAPATEGDAETPAEAKATEGDAETPPEVAATVASGPPGEVPRPPQTTRSSAIADSLGLGDAFFGSPAPADADSLLGIIEYEAERIVFLAERNEIRLHEQAIVNYEGTKLEAEDVRFFVNERQLIANGNPVLTERNERVDGTLMTYDLNRREGEVQQGVTTFEAGIYSGMSLHRAADGVFYVEGASYTTCDSEEPHYHFAGHQMKIYLNDKVVTRPAVLYFGEVPVLALPFYLFPIKRGRQSGLLVPRIEVGVSQARGRFIENAGYYWVINDYADLELAADIRENSPSFIGKTRFRYAKRYTLNGDVRLTSTIGADTRRWDVVGNHSQQLAERLRFRANLNFLSDRDFRLQEQGQFVPDRLNTELRSNATFDKSWESQSLTVGIDRTQRLQDDLGETAEGEGQVTGKFPRVGYSFSPRTIGARPDAKGRGGRWPFFASTNYRFNLSYENDFNDDRAGNKYLQRASGNATVSDSRTLGYVRLGPAIGASSNYDQRTETTNDEGQLVPDVGHILRGSWNASIFANTDIYGRLRPTIGPFHGFRHVFSPRVSITYSRPFDSRPEIPVDSRSTLSVTLSNRFQTRYRSGEDLQVVDNFLTADLSAQYDLSNRSEQRLSTIRVNGQFRPGLGSLFDTSYSLDYDPYKRRNIRYRTNTRFRFDRRPPRAEDEREPQDDDTLGLDDDLNRPGGALGADRQDLNVGDQPVFPQQFTFSGSLTFAGGEGAEKSLQTQLGTQFNVTPKWRFSYQLLYDLMDQVVAAQSYVITRDLHAWEAQFRRSFSGGRWEYYFRISLKDLPDIFYERGTRSSAGPSLF